MGVYTLVMSRGRPQGEDRQRIVLNVRSALAAEVKALAEAERRSMNSQVELLIERGLQDWPRMTPVVAEVAA